MIFCVACGEVVMPNEASCFGGRHEDCWTAASCDIDEARRAELDALADGILDVQSGVRCISGVTQHDVDSLCSKLRDAMSQ